MLCKMNSIAFEYQSVFYLTNNQVYHIETKHIDVRFHKIKALLALGQMLLENVHTYDVRINDYSNLEEMNRFLARNTYKQFLNLFPKKKVMLIETIDENFEIYCKTLDFNNNSLIQRDVNQVIIKDQSTTHTQIEQYFE